MRVNEENVIKEMRKILKLLIHAFVRKNTDSINEAIGKLSTLISILSATEEEQIDITSTNDTKRY